MNELVVISGKGGTGKTSVVAAFAALAGDAVLADCDVDAADLHLVLSPQVKRREVFRSGHVAVIRQADCTGCGQCLTLCRFGAVIQVPRMAEAPQAPGARAACDDCDFCERSCSVRLGALTEEVGQAGVRLRDVVFAVDPVVCEGCGVCVRFCPAQAIDFPERVCGEWFVSETRFGPMVHARLGIAAENSGKLVATVRREAQRLATAGRRAWILVDGPPGLGCPVIASLTGASMVLVVTEPTLSGKHDLERVLSLTRHFDIPTLVCVNKWDINPALTEAIERQAVAAGARVAGRIRYDRAVTAAQLGAQTVTEYGGPAADDIRALWNIVKEKMQHAGLIA